MIVRRRKLVLFDRDEEYAIGLMNYFSTRNNRPFEVVTYTTIASFGLFIEEQNADILLISEDALECCGTDMIKELSIPKVIVLTEDAAEDMVEDFSTIYKYQSAENIMKEIYEFYAEEDDAVYGTSIKEGKTKLIAVYSPVRRSLKTSFAMTMGQILSETQRVLYINLEDYAGFNSLLRTSYATDMSDLIYYISQKKRNFMWKLSSMVQSIGGLDYIPPALCPMDIKEITQEQWLSFFDELAGCEYETIIIDLGDGVRGIYQILRRCSRIYTPTRDDGISYAKMEQYEALLNVMEYEDILAKTRKLSFSYFKGLERGLDRLVYSELGQYVRALLKEDGVIS